MNSFNHVAIIMDGNGRWATQRNRPRVWGHIRGSNIVADIVEKADDLGVKYLTMYALSYENLSRPQSELKVLYKLLEKFLKKERARIIKNDICFRIVGDYSFVSESLQGLIASMEEDTRNAQGLNLSFAFGHSGRKTIENCVRYFAQQSSRSAVKVTQQAVESFFKSELPDVDLMIRTGGDSRISNFLLWQLSYSELCFIPEQWPDFTTTMFERILYKYSQVEKRFGGIDQWGELSEAQEAARKSLKENQHGIV